MKKEEKRPGAGKLFLSLFVLAALTGVLFLVFRDHLDEIAEAVQSLRWTDLLILTAVGMSVPVLDSLIFKKLVCNESPQFPFRQAFAFTMLGTFGKVTMLSAGILPMKAYYLHKNGVDLGHGVGMVTLRYVLHKTTILAVSLVLLCVHGKWMHQSLPEIGIYIFLSCGLCGLLILAMLLLCTSRHVYEFALWACNGILRKKENWRQKTEKQLTDLFRASNGVLHNRKALLPLMILSLLKLLGLCVVPYLCMTMLDLTGLSFSQSVLLTVLTLLIAGCLPNVAGIGPTELSFLVLFGLILGESTAAPILLLFRLTTYYLPFLFSIAVFFAVQKKIFQK